MKLVGYGITRNGKPSGIWPINLQRALERRSEMASEKSRGEKIEVVPIYVGEPLTNVAVPPRQKEEELA